MKTLLTAAALILTVNTAQAAGFSPWSDAATTPVTVESANAQVEAAGFAPWRGEGNDIDVGGARDMTEIANMPHDPNVFRPWS